MNYLKLINNIYGKKGGSALVSLLPPGTDYLTAIVAVRKEV